MIGHPSLENVVMWTICHRPPSPHTNPRTPLFFWTLSHKIPLLLCKMLLLFLHLIFKQYGLLVKCINNCQICNAFPRKCFWLLTGRRFRRNYLKLILLDSSEVKHSKFETFLSSGLMNFLLKIDALRHKGIKRPLLRIRKVRTTPSHRAAIKGSFTSYRWRSVKNTWRQRTKF